MKDFKVDFLGTKKRKMISKVTINNFKSIKRMKLEFVEGMNTICAPNGNGKSNILDAIAFALTAELKILRVTNAKELVLEEGKDSGNTFVSLTLTKKKGVSNSHILASIVM